ncbi:InlB B-repeat-containing protein, partial [Lacrimispora sp.]|uniref:InlB B-repeat-containing protein n=1 Tax=Lacrimispora sp. TaxID=2719234 RepID=UPI0034605121
MKQLRRKLRQSLAGFLALCLTMTSFNMVSWADVEKAFDSGNAIFMISGEDLRNSAQAAIDAGETFQVDDLGLGDEDQSLKREYEKLFGKGRVYEFSPDYYLDEEASADGAELRMFIRTADTDGEYLLTGDEEVIFLYLNESDEKITFRSNIDGYLTQKVSVKAFSEGAEAIPNVPEVQPELPVPDEGVVNPEETEAEEESEAVDETEDAEETGSTEETEEDGNVEESSEAEDGTEDTEEGSGTESGSDETADDEGQADSEEASDDADTGSEDSDTGSSDDGVSESEDTDSGYSDEGSGAQASISRHVLSVLTSSDITALEEGTPSEAEPETEEEGDNFFISDKGKSFDLIDLEDNYTARAFVIRLNELMKNTETIASSSNAAVTVQFLKAEDHEKIKPDAVYNVENSSYEVGDEVDVTGFADEISGYEFAYFQLEDMSEEGYLTLESDNLIKLYYNQTEIQDGYQIQVIHKLSADEKEYYQRIFVDFKNEDFDEDGNYNYSDSIIKMDGVEAVTDISSMIINKAQFEENPIAETIIEYRLLEGWGVREVAVKSRMLMAASVEVWPQIVLTGYTVSVESNGPGTTTLTYGTTVTTIPRDGKKDMSGIASEGSVTLTFTPDANYALGMLRVNKETISLSSVSGKNTYTISNIEKDYSVEVIYAEMKKSTLTWLRSDDINSDAGNRKNESEIRSYNNKNREFTWDQMDRLTPRHPAWDQGTYYDGYVGEHHSFNHAFATWKFRSGEDKYDLRRFRTTFKIPEGYSAQDYIRLQTVTQDRYSNLGNDGKIIPINDDIFVFVYKEGETIKNSNKDRYLAFWTGTEPNSEYLGKKATEATHADRAVIPYTDGWYCEAELDNVGASLTSNYPKAEAGDTFVLDVFVGEYATGGGMDALDLGFVKASGYGVTVKYYKDNFEGTPIGTAVIKNLSLGEIIDLSTYEDGSYLDKYLSSLPSGYDSGKQMPETYKVIEDGVIKVLYSKSYRDIDVKYYTKEDQSVQKVWQGTYSGSFPTGITYEDAVDKNKLSDYIGSEAAAYDEGVVTDAKALITKSTTEIEVVYTKKAVYPLAYYANAPAGSVTGMPSGGFYYSGQSVILGNAPTRQGYDFAGWARTEDGSVEHQANAAFTMPANEVNLYAVWTPGAASYEIRYYFEQNNGTFTIDPDKTEEVSETTGTKVNADISKVFDGYFFDGENENNVLSGEVVGDKSLALELYYKQKKAITVKPSPASKPYDGTPLKSDAFERPSGLRVGDDIYITTTGSITNVSQSAENNNPIAEKGVIITRNGNNVTSQYNITTLPGKLTITRRQVTITADSASKVYDGTALKKET